MAGTSQESETIFDDVENPQGTAPEETGEEQLEKGKEGAATPIEEEEPQKEAPDFEGLPFKDIKALVKGYKDLQGKATKRDQEFAQMQTVLQEILPRLPRQTQEEVKEDPEAFVQAFVQNPKAVLNDLIKQAMTTTIRETVEPLQGQVRGLSGHVELQRFLENHPEIEDGDEELLMEMMDKYPEVRTRQDRLEVWYKLLVNEHPDIKERMKQRKDDLEKGASDAKKAASLGGKKSSTPTSQKDEFDEVIDLWKQKRSYFER